MSTADLILCHAVLHGRLYRGGEPPERGIRLVLEERLSYVRRELDLRAVQLSLWD